jgi:hypothetical protein
MRVRAHHPFQTTRDVPDNIPWQDWIESKGVVDATSGGGRMPAYRSHLKLYLQFK